MTPQGAAAFVHPALFYNGDQQYLTGLVPFIQDGLAAGDPVAAAVPTPRLELLRSALGADSHHVELIDMAEAGRNPGRIIAEVLRGFADEHPGRSVRIIGEPIWPGRTNVEYPACVQHEALINLAFAGRDVTIVCPYDADRLDERVLLDARATHPLLWQNGLRRASPQFAPADVYERYNEPLPDAPISADFRTVRTVAELPGVRRFAADVALRLGLAANRVEDLELICTELVGNSVLHGGAECRMRMWRAANWLVFEVSDSGTIDDPLAGRRPADPMQPGGRGLLVVHHLADLVRSHTAPGRTTIQAYLALE